MRDFAKLTAAQQVEALKKARETGCSFEGGTAELLVSIGSHGDSSVAAVSRYLLDPMPTFSRGDALTVLATAAQSGADVTPVMPALRTIAEHGTAEERWFANYAIRQQQGHHKRTTSSFIVHPPRAKVAVTSVGARIMRKATIK